MRNELELIEKIEQYLQGKLTEADKLAFEKEIQNDLVLKQKVEAQQEILKGVERVGLKKNAQNAYSKFKLTKNFLRWGLGGLCAVIIATSVYFITANHSSHTEHKSEYELPQVNENGNKLWADADKNLPYQRFSIDNSKDTVLETRSGIVFVIPANCFKDKSGNKVNDIEFQVKEALDPSDMMLAGLSTRSGETDLETGGMFYVDAMKGDEHLKIDPNNGIYTEVPTKNHKPGMQLYHGERKPDGSIDWVNPKPMEKYLVPVNILSLNFYPPHYLDSLKGWKYNIKDKKFTDSLYYSFASMFGNYGEEHLKADSTRKYGEPHNSPPMPRSALDDSIEDSNNRIAETDFLYMKSCQPCHFLDNRMSTAPGFAGISSRHTKEWSFLFTKNNKSFAKINKEAANAQYESPNDMTVFEGKLSDNQIKTLIDYIYENDKISQSKDFIGPKQNIVGINPAKIKAIWNSTFNNTLLATKEFEERLKVIHATCDESILDLYVNNLDKRLCAIDSMAMSTCSEGDIGSFAQFASRGDGRVKTNSKTVQVLKRYYETKTKAFTEAITKTVNDFWEKQSEKDREYYQKNWEHAQADSDRKWQNFNKEFKINLDEAYRQLGYHKTDDTYGGTVTQTGWNNVDQAVYASTLNRTTLNYTDPNSGKTALIRYAPLNVKIIDGDKYDRTLCYLTQHELYSFIRMKGDKGNFTEKMNELVNYDLVCIGIKDGKSSLFTQVNVKPGNLGNITLSPVSEGELKSKLNSFAPSSQTKDILDDMIYQKFEVKDLERQKLNMDREKLKVKVFKVIFPCAEYPDAEMRAAFK
jgi:hypothetical protein